MWIWKWGCELLISNCSFNACITAKKINLTHFPIRNFTFHSSDTPSHSLVRVYVCLFRFIQFCENQIWFEQLKIKNSSSSNCYLRNRWRALLLIEWKFETSFQIICLHHTSKRKVDTSYSPWNIHLYSTSFQAVK